MLTYCGAAVTDFSIIRPSIVGQNQNGPRRGALAFVCLEILIRDVGKDEKLLSWFVQVCRAFTY